MFDVKKVKIIATMCLFAFALFFVALPPASAALDVGLDPVGSATGLGKQDLREMIGSIIQVALGFLGVVAIVIVLIGGFLYMTAGGSDEKAAKARKWIVSGIIGLAIILSAYAITSFVVDSLISATTGGGLD
jgi:hypothetical protein